MGGFRTRWPTPNGLDVGEGEKEAEEEEKKNNGLISVFRETSLSMFECDDL